MKDKTREAIANELLRFNEAYDISDDLLNTLYEYVDRITSLITPPQDGAEQGDAITITVGQAAELSIIFERYIEDPNYTLKSAVADILSCVAQSQTAALRARVDAQNNELVSLRTTIADLWAAEIERDQLRAENERLRSALDGADGVDPQIAFTKLLKFVEANETQQGVTDEEIEAEAMINTVGLQEFVSFMCGAKCLRSKLAQPKTDGWVSAETDPTEYGYYLVWFVNEMDSDMTVMYYGKRWDGGIGWAYSGVTHWQSLPAPPKTD